MQPMQQQQWGAPQPPVGPPRKGRGFVIAGSVMVGLAILGVAITVLVLGRSFDPDSLTRDVVLSGPSPVEVPGRIGFRVIEDLSSDNDTMSVGVALEPDTATAANAVTCAFVVVEGDEVVSRNGGELDTFLSSDLDSEQSPVVVADDLAPGDYVATCELDGEPSDGQDVQFAVGRVVSPTELFGLVGPVFWILGAVVMGGIVGAVGLVLLVIGLVQNSRARTAS